MDIHTRRRNRVQELIDARFAGSKSAFSKESGVSLGYLSRMLNPDSPQHKRIGEDLARNIERTLKLTSGWLDGESASKVSESTTLYGISISQEGVAVGHEWEKLQEPLRTQIQVLIETLVAKQVRSVRKKKDARKDAQRQPRAHA